MLTHQESDEESEEYTYGCINHYSEYFGGNASEYIVPKEGDINITSHQMGSGIYGISEVQEQKQNHTKKDGVDKYVFKMDLPFVIDNQKQCDEYVKASTHLSDNLQQLAIKSRKNQSIITTKETFLPIADQFIKEINIKEFNRDTVSTAISSFWYDYWHRDKYVEMPINYILKSEGNDGVMSHPSTECHRWNRGDVKFLSHYPTGKTGDISPVNFILSRIGIEKIPFCIGYKLEGDIWVKPVKLAKPVKIMCRICDKVGHAAWRCPNR